MDKTFRNLISITGLVIVVIALGIYFLSAVEFYKFTLLLSIGLILVAIRFYNFPTVDQFLYLGVAWFLGIYGMSSMFTTYDTLPLMDFKIGIWFLVYPSLIILYQLTDLSDEKKWHLTAVAAADTFVIFGAIILLASAINSLGLGSLSAGITNDWRELYIYGIGLLLYGTAKRDDFREEAKAEWNYYWKLSSGIFAFLGGLFLLSVAIYSFIVLSSISVPIFLIEALGGIFVCFMVYLLFQK